MENSALIIDNGTFTIKAGFASDDQPRSVFPSIVGRPKHMKGRIGKELYDVFIGDEAAERHNVLDLNCPMDEGIVKDWDDMERLWHHVFYRELKIAPEERPVLMSCVPQCSLAIKEKTCQVMFETLNVPCLFLASSSLLSLYSSGRASGVVVDSGHTYTHIAPIHEGNPVNCAHIKYPLAGKHVTDTLMKLLNKKHFIFSKDNWKDRTSMEDIKRKYCFVSTKNACPKLKPLEYKLPDGRRITIREEGYTCTEQFFRPESAGYEFKCLPYSIDLAVKKCDSDVREMLLNNVVLCGGNSLLKNFSGRLLEELHETKPETNVYCGEERAVSAWLGGSIFAGMQGVMEYWLTKKQYEEGGSKDIKIKFM